MIDKGWAEKLDKDAIPNIENLVDVQQHPGFDPDREYTLPWQSGMTGIAYNAKLTKPITSIDQLLEDKSLKGKVTMLDELRRHARRSSCSRTATTRARSPTTPSRARSTASRPRSDSGQFRQFTGNDYTGPAGEGRPQGLPRVVGRHRPAPRRQPEPEVGDPDDGGMIWTDNMLIPKGGDAYTASTST